MQLPSSVNAGINVDSMFIKLFILIIPLNFDNDWDIFCDEIYDHLKEQKREKSFYNFMSKVLKYTFLQAMVSELDEINIYHFIDTLSFLYSDGFFVKDGPVVAKLKKNIIKKISLNNKKLVRYW